MSITIAQIGMRIVAVLVGCLIYAAAFSQPFKLMRYDENYSIFKDSSRNFYRSLKYIPLSNNGSVYASFGGSARLEYVNFNNEDWGRVGIGRNNFLLQRYDVHADLHIGNRVRLFAQIRSAWENGRKNGPRPIDEDQLNIQNLFIDVKLLQQSKASLTARLGRQELDYGSGRLISVREGPNLRLYFNGGKLMYTTSKFSLDGFIMLADTMNTGAFDNKPSRQINLWGLYSKIILDKAANVDLYYLGVHRKQSLFEEGLESETRHTIGTRIWRYGGGFIYNFEGAVQFGTFGSGKINAWTASADIGYLFEHVKGKPSINLRNDYISGDAHQGDGDLQSFNPLYPKGGYFGFSPQIGPVNLIDLHPYVTVNPGQKISAQVDVVMNWRYSLQDGIYRPSGNFNMAGSASSKRYIGTAYLASVLYTINKFIAINSGIQYFKTGDFINDLVSEPKDGLFVNTRLSIKF